MTILAIGRLEGPDYFILAGYFILMLGIGAYFYRYMWGMKDYFSGGNRIPWWLSGVSFYMSCFSAYAFITYSAMAYKYGLPAVVLFSLKSIAVIVSVVFFAKRWRRARIDSPVEYLESRYSPAVRQLFAWQGIPVRVIDDA
ncbi:MAG: sodium:solute symporter family transporter, partial [Planctomycetota bacterium]